MMWLTVVVAASLHLAACAPDVVRKPIEFVPAVSHSKPILQLTEDVNVRLTLYERVLASGSKWVYLGRVPAGNVYRKSDGVLTIEGAHVHEAYLVEMNGELLGFYLPGENAYAALPTKLPLPYKKTEEK